MKARYLTFFSYIGTPFRSSQKLWMKDNVHHPDPQSVQGLIELALLKLRSLVYPVVTLSSRTDGGVHALSNTAHFDLERFGENIYEPVHILNNLNKTFCKNNTSIQIHRCIRVNDNFHARFYAKSRTYLYRFAVLNEHPSLPERVNLPSLIPIEEWRRCQFMRIPNFNIEKFKAATKYFVGYHDFTSFKKFTKGCTKHNRRQLLEVDVLPGRPYLISSRESEDPFTYYELRIKGRGFVHNQIRRMVGAAIGVATDKIPLKEIEVMLQVPSKHCWPSQLSVMPADGLFLCDVEYDPQDLVYDGSRQDVISES